VVEEISAGSASESPMSTAQVIDVQGSRAVKLPDEYRIEADTVSVRWQGAAIVIEAVKPATWPEGFFEAIRIDDPAFVRPEQGVTPSSPTLE
jgi:virulence-associated protein VagC